MAESQTILAGAADRKAVTLLYPAPMARADVVLGAPGRTRATTRLATIVRAAARRRALAEEGWKEPGAVQGTAPDAVTLAAMRAAWENQ